jgi:hypothetical protein
MVTLTLIYHWLGLLDLAYFFSTFIPNICIFPDGPLIPLAPLYYTSKTQYFVAFLQKSKLYPKVRYKKTYATISLLLFQIVKHST